MTDDRIEPSDLGDDGDGPRLPSNLGVNPSIVVPPARHGYDDVDLEGDRGEFNPLRVDPPPSLMPTWWLRYALTALLFGALGLALYTEYTGVEGDALKSPSVAALHLAAATCLIVWNVLSMYNADTLVPATRYQHRSRGWLAATLWVLAFVAPVATIRTHAQLGERIADPNDPVALVVFVGAVLVAFLLVWAPFRYCARQASRIGAPHGTIIAWFWTSLVTLVGGFAITALGLHEALAEDGTSAADQVVGIGVVYGLPMFVFALGTWRAVTVFDEVIDLRWNRWRTEWEQTLRDFADQPAPGPEASPRAPSGES